MNMIYMAHPDNAVFAISIAQWAQVVEEHIIGRTFLGGILAHGNAGAGTPVDLICIDHCPAALLEQFVDDVAGLMFLLFRRFFHSISAMAKPTSAVHLPSNQSQIPSRYHFRGYPPL
jgi:hypothetical protein